MKVGSILEWKFPGQANVGYEVSSITDEEGEPTGDQRISMWDEQIMGRPKPNQQELEGWELPAAKQGRRRALRLAAELEYDTIFVQDGESFDMFKDRLLVKLGRGSSLSQSETTARDKMAAVQDKMTTKLQGVRDAATVEEVQSITW